MKLLSACLRQYAGLAAPAPALAAVNQAGRVG
jgi:hypothetical protein